MCDVVVRFVDLPGEIPWGITDMDMERKAGQRKKGEQGREWGRWLCVLVLVLVEVLVGVCGVGSFYY